MSSDSAYLNLPIRSESEARSDIARDTDALDRWRERNAEALKLQQVLVYTANSLYRAIVPEGFWE